MIAVAAMCVVLFLMLMGVETGYYDRYTCVLCRVNRIDNVFLGRLWESSCTDTVCTPWYREHVEPSHEHVWVRGRAMALRNVFGWPVSVIDRDESGKAIWWLSPEDQVAIYEHLPPEDRKRIFLGMVEKTKVDNRYDYVVMHSLREWKESGFVGEVPKGVEE